MNQPPIDQEAEVALAAFETTPALLESIGRKLVAAVTAHYARSAETLFPSFSEKDMEGYLLTDPPEHSTGAEAVSRMLIDRILPNLFNAQQPDIYHLMSSPLPLLAVFEIVSGYLNVQPYGLLNDKIQMTVIGWLGSLTGFADRAAGLFTKGGTTSNLYALAVARVHTLGRDFRKKGAARGPVLTAYVSEEGHACLDKAVELLGIGSEQLRKIPVTQEQAIDLQLLRQQIILDKETGFHPFCIIANAGSARTGVVDPLHGLSDLAAEFRLWLHVDGAYGAFGAMTPLARHRFAGLDRADSLSLDPHKWMSVPYECSCLLVRDGQLLQEAFEHIPDYLGMFSNDKSGGFSRNFDFTQSDKALKVFLAFHLYGVENYRKLFESHIRMAAAFAEIIAACEDFELCHQPALSIVCFRFVPASLHGITEARQFYIDNLNRAIELSLKEKNVLITTARLNGYTVLRVCFVSHRVSFERLHPLATMIHAAGAAIHGRTRLTASSQRSS
jgi:aromatic-L-amino-acid/L-tryptophan decarboxylase